MGLGPGRSHRMRAGLSIKGPRRGMENVIIQVNKSPMKAYWTMKYLLMGLLFVMCGASTAGAMTWRVEQDGSGDFERIQSAVDASASGDTILIGPGFYNDFGDLPSKIGDKTWYTVASWNETKDLTFIGEDVESVVIGNESYSAGGDGFGGLANMGDGDLRCENITFRYLRAGIWSYWDMTVVSCRFEQNYWSVISQDQISCEIRECSFAEDQYQGRGIFFQNANEVFVADCELTNSGFYFGGVIWSSIVGTRISNGGNQFVHSNGEFVNNECTGSGVEITTASQVSVSDNIFVGGVHNLYIGDPNTEAELYGNILSDSEYTAVFCDYVSRVFGQGNHIFKGTGDYIIYTRGYSSSQIGLRNNYWGTTDPDQLAEWIWDGNDQSGYPIVDYLPFSDTPLPTEPQSWGSIKAMYR